MLNTEIPDAEYPMLNIEVGLLSRLSIQHSLSDIDFI